MRANQKLITSFLLSVVAMAQPAATFTPTGSMTTSRIGYSATLLPNGKVLIAGGISGHSTLATTELYDPSTGVFTPAGSMISARASHTATLLPDGRILIAGGGPLTAELYDPSTGVFSATTSLLDGAGRAILLANGKVLITSGDMVTELYDPALGTFSATGNQHQYSGDQATIALLPEDTVLLVNCCGPEEQLYDPSAGIFSFTGGLYDAFNTIGTMNVFGDGFAGAQLANGNVLVSGGFEEETNTTGIEAKFYDWRLGVFVRTGDMTTPRYYHTATTLGDGTVLIAGSGGMPYVLIPVASAEIYDPVQGVFSATASMVTGRFGHTATLLLDGRVLIAGSSAGITSAEIYTPSAPVPAPTLFPGAIWHASTGQVASAANPAVAGEALSMYTTSLIEGGMIPPQVSVGGRLADILYFGDAPGYPGYFQVNFRFPDGVSSGAALPVRLTYLGRPSNQVIVAAQ